MRVCPSIHDCHTCGGDIIDLLTMNLSYVWIYQILNWFLDICFYKILKWHLLLNPSTSRLIPTLSPLDRNNSSQSGHITRFMYRLFGVSASIYVAGGGRTSSDPVWETLSFYWAYVTLIIILVHSVKLVTQFKVVLLTSGFFLDLTNHYWNCA